MVKTKDGFYKQIGTTEGNNSYLLLAGGDYVGFSNSSGSSTIVQRDANGYIANNYFYTSGGGAERNASSLGYIAGFNTSDYYIRSYTSAAVKTWLGLGSNAYTSTAYLPLSGGTMTGNIILKGSTSADMTDTNIHPRLRFDNSDSSQTVSFIFTDYDAYRTPAGIKLIGNQGNEWFEAPNLIKTGSSDSYVLLGGGGHRALSTFTPSLVTSTTSSGVTNVATSNTNTYLNIVQGGASAGSSTQVTGTGSVTVSSDASGKLTINGVNSYLPLSGGTLTGSLSTKSNAYYYNSDYGINMNNSDIIGANSIYFQDYAENYQEGIHFKRNDGNWDSLWGQNNKLYFTVNRTLVDGGTGTYTIWHSGNDGAGSGLDADTLDGYHNREITARSLVRRDFSNIDDAMTTSSDYGLSQWSGWSSTITNGISGGYNVGITVCGVDSTKYGFQLGVTASASTDRLYYKGWSYNGNSGWKGLAFLTDNVASATRLQTARTINGTNFDGLVNITTANWGTARNISIGSTTKSVNGSANVSWSLADIGAAGLSGGMPSSIAAYNPYWVGRDGRTNDMRGTQIPYVINHHTGISLSAHSAYSGIRLWLQGGSTPYNHDGTLVAQFSTAINHYVHTAATTITTTGTITAPTFSGGRFYTGYDSGVANSMSCSGWFRSNGATGWYNATYGGGIYQDDSTYVKIYGNKAFKVTSTASDSINTSGGILASGNITAPRFVCSTNNQITTSGGYLALQTNGSNITVGGASSMYVNYLPAVGGTPTSWIWSAGSSTSWANFYIGSLNTYGPISCSSTITTASYVSSAQGYYKSGSSNDYVLLGSGSHKLISDFRLKSEKVLRMVFRGYFKWSGTNLTPSESDVVYSDFCTSYSISRVSTGRYRITFTGLKTTSNIAPDKTLQIFGAGRNINSSDGNPCYVAISNIDSSYFDIIIADDNTTNDNTSFTLYINQML